MSGIAVVGLDSAGGPHLGGGQSILTVNGQPVVVVGDPVTPHGESSHAAAVMEEGSSIVTVNGIPVCREGDKASCGHTSTGRSWFTVAD